MPNYADLWQWSINNPEIFWKEIWEAFEVQSSIRADLTVANKEKLPVQNGFPGARLNFAENLLRRSDSAEAIISSENGAVARGHLFSTSRTGLDSSTVSAETKYPRWRQSCWISAQSS